MGGEPIAIKPGTNSMLRWSSGRVTAEQEVLGSIPVLGKV